MFFFTYKNGKHVCFSNRNYWKILMISCVVAWHMSILIGILDIKADVFTYSLFSCTKPFRLLCDFEVVTSSAQRNCIMANILTLILAISCILSHTQFTFFLHASHDMSRLHGNMFFQILLGFRQAIKSKIISFWL